MNSKITARFQNSNIMGIFMPNGLKFLELIISIIHYILMQFNMKFEIPEV